MANCTALSVSLGEKKPSCSLKFSITSNSKIKVPAEIPSALILCCGSPNPKPPTQWTIRMLFHGTALYLGRKELGCEVGAAEIGGVREVRAFPVKQGEVTLKPSSWEGGQVALHQQQQECSWATGPAVSTMPSAARSSPHARSDGQHRALPSPLDGCVYAASQCCFHTDVRIHEEFHRVMM